MLASLIQLISQTAPLSPADEALVAAHFEALDVPKNTVLEAAGQVPGHLYFVGTGYLRLYYDEAAGTEATTFLAGPADFVTPFLSFIHQQRAPESLATITPCAVLRISHARLTALIADSGAFQQFSLLIFEHAIAATGRRADGLATLNAEQRYRQLLQARPELPLHVPVQLLASYLGVKPESLSRIRRRVVS